MQQVSYRQGNRPELGTGAYEAHIEPQISPNGVHVLALEFILSDWFSFLWQGLSPPGAQGWP